MRRIPWRIECFDNSSLAGTEAVAGMVVFEKGRPSKKDYRTYRIREAKPNDDYACMAEVLKRRCGKGEKSKPFPDLLMVDGGKGQLNIAVSVMKKLDLAGEFEIIGIAKKDKKRGELKDKIYKPNRVNPVNMGPDGHLLHFLQRVRDESHRFAISFHKKRRLKEFKKSALDDIPGIGEKRKKVLLKQFGSIGKIRAASLAQLSALPGMNRKVAQSLKEGLK